MALFFFIYITYFSKEGEKVEDETTEDPSYYDPKEDSTLADEVTVIKVCKSRVYYRYTYTHVQGHIILEHLASQVFFICYAPENFFQGA